MTERVYGCHNRAPLKTEALVQTGWQSMPLSMNEWTYTRAPVLAHVPDEMSKDCKYTRTDLGQNDARCAGCRWRHEGTPS